MSREARLPQYLNEAQSILNILTLWETFFIELHLSYSSSHLLDLSVRNLQFFPQLCPFFSPFLPNKTRYECNNLVFTPFLHESARHSYISEYDNHSASMSQFPYRNQELLTANFHKPDKSEISRGLKYKAPKNPLNFMHFPTNLHPLLGYQYNFLLLMAF